MPANGRWDLTWRLKGNGQKSNAVPLQVWTGPEDSSEVGVPRFCDNGTGWW